LAVALERLAAQADQAVAVAGLTAQPELPVLLGKVTPEVTARTTAQAGAGVRARPAVTAQQALLVMAEPVSLTQSQDLLQAKT
jgi:hypothetical protein